MNGYRKSKRLPGLITWIENAVSVLFFTGMFGAIMVQVFYRYVLKSPLVWPYELSIYCFIYIVFFGAAIASRKNTHIVFGMFYDRMAPRAQWVVSVVSNIVIIVILLSVFPSTFSFISFMGGIRSSSMGIPMYVVLSAFPIGMGLVVLYMFLRTLNAIRDSDRLKGD